MRNNNPHLLSIGEVAKSLHITRRILLNYEDKGLVHPDVKEGKGGNRYYTTDTVTRIRAIRRLQSLGISLDEIKLYFEDKADLREFIGRLENMRDELDLCIEKLRLRVSENEEDVIEVREIPAQTVYIRRCSTPTVAHRMEIFRQVIPEAMRLYGSDSSKRMFLLAYPLEDTDDTRFCVAVPQGSRGDGVEQWEKERAVSVFSMGITPISPEYGKSCWTMPGSTGCGLRGPAAISIWRARPTTRMRINLSRRWPYLLSNGEKCGIVF